MIGFNHLGRHGRLGNQMFQYAALRGIAALKGYSFCIPNSDFRNEWEDHQLFLGFELPNLKKIKILPNDYYQEKQFHYDSDYVKNCPDNISLYGYFQSEKYFKHIEDSIREDFKFKSDIVDACKEFFNFEEMISIHVRRTDYVSNSANHPPCPLSYYEESLKKFDSEIPVMIFSDDVGWCKCQDLFSSDRFLISEPQEKYGDGSYTPYADLCLMSLCSHAIIANSSMSWWGAWLINNPNKKVIAPKMWFGPAYADKDTKDLYSKNWIVL